MPCAHPRLVVHTTLTLCTHQLHGAVKDGQDEVHLAPGDGRVDIANGVQHLRQQLPGKRRIAARSKSHDIYGACSVSSRDFSGREHMHDLRKDGGKVSENISLRNDSERQSLFVSFTLTHAHTHLYSVNAMETVFRHAEDIVE